jgi:hypothetical protein
MIPLGIEPATFRLVVQCLKQLRYGTPLSNLVGKYSSEIIKSGVTGEVICNVARTHTHKHTLLRGDICF